MLPKVNKYNTSLEDLKIEDYPKEVQEQFWDFFYNVPYIQSLVSSNRPRAKDIKRDSDGKIIVDITKPHILEDIDYFRPTALHYIKTGKFTDLRPNPNPNSEFGKWFLEEVRRCREGYMRPSDGEWIPGDLYFFWNYNLISLTEQKDKNKKKALRIVAPPHVWDGHYYKFHYLNQARENGKHCLELASRQKGKTICAASLLAKRFYLGESAEVNKRVNCYVTAQDTKFIKNNADQTLDKFQFIIDFLADNTEFPKRRLVSSLQQMQWTSGFIDLDTNTRKGTLNSVTGISAKDDESKLRGTRGVLYILEESGTFPRLIKLWNNMLPSVQDGDMVYGTLYGYGCCCEGTKVWTSDGIVKNIEDIKKGEHIIGFNGNSISNEEVTWLQPTGYKHCVEIECSGHQSLKCSTDHPLMTLTKNKFGVAQFITFKKAEDLVNGDILLQYNNIPVFGNVHENNAYILGMLFGDGSYSGRQCVTLSITTPEVYNWINDNYDIGISKLRTTKNNETYAQLYFKSFHWLLKKYKMDGQSFENKKLPYNIFEWDKESLADFIGGYFEADGNVKVLKNKYVILRLTCKYKEILEQIQLLLLKFGISSSIIESHKPGGILHSGVNNKDYVMKPVTCYDLYIEHNQSVRNFQKYIHFKSKYKQDRLDKVLYIDDRTITDHPYIQNVTNKKGEYFIGKQIKGATRIVVKNVKDIGIQKIYNLTANTTHTYLTNGFISHNTAGDNQSDFYAMAEMMYHPDGYDIYGVENVYDLEGKGGKKFSYFFPGYLNYSGMYDKNGNSDVTKALLTILMKRYEKKKSTSDFTAVTKLTAEIPIVPQEAIIRTRGNFFPVALINERIAQLELNPREYDDVLVGTLVMQPNGSVEFKPTDDEVITQFPLKDNKATGALQIFKLPEKRNGVVQGDRYVIGHDPVNQDEADSMSLSSTFVVDLFTETIVAEYTGRKEFQEDSFELLRLLGIFYNAPILYESNNKMCYAYFSKMNCTYMLADTPEYLREKDIVKKQGFGNSSKGVPATAMLNKHEDELLRDWLLMPKTKIEKNQDGDDVETTIPNVMTIRNLALLKELSRYAPDINVDRVRAMGITMIMRNDLVVKYGGSVTGENTDEYIPSQDDFFKRNGFI